MIQPSVFYCKFFFLWDQVAPSCVTAVRKGEGEGEEEEEEEEEEKMKNCLFAFWREREREKEREKEKEEREKRERERERRPKIDWLFLLPTKKNSSNPKKRMKMSRWTFLVPGKTWGGGGDNTQPQKNGGWGFSV